MAARGFLHIICDYGTGDLAMGEVVQSVLASLQGEWERHLTTVHNFDTISTGFVVAQYALQDPDLRPKETVIYANCAPRKDRSEARENNEGEEFVLAVLNNGVKVLAVNSGNSISFIKDYISKLYELDVQKSGSQFRSRDYFPKALGRVLSGDKSVIVQELNPKEKIPDVPRGVIAYVDNFGNLKTTFRDGDGLIEELRSREAGSKVEIEINRKRHAAYIVSTGSFSVAEGEMAFAPGSSGHSKRYWELFQRGASAAESFGNPPVGTQILIGLK